MDFKITQREFLPCTEINGGKQPAHPLFRCTVGPLVGVNRDTASPRHDSHTADVVVVLMGDQYGRDPVGMDADARKPFLYFLAGEAGINKEGSPAGFNQGAVSLAAASQNTDLHGASTPAKTRCPYDRNRRHHALCRPDCPLREAGPDRPEQESAGLCGHRVQP